MSTRKRRTTRRQAPEKQSGKLTVRLDEDSLTRLAVLAALRRTTQASIVAEALAPVLRRVRLPAVVGDPFANAETPDEPATCPPVNVGPPSPA